MEIMTGWDANRIPREIRTDNNGFLSSGISHELSIALGDIPGYSHVSLFGRNPDSDALNGFETVWNGGGIYQGTNATSGEIVTIVSSDINDSAAGSGARTVKFEGLSGSFVYQSETVTLNGTTPVDTVNSYKRFIKMTGITAGNNGANLGTLTAKQKVTTANVFCVMPIGFNHTAVGAYTVPAGKTGYLRCWEFALAGQSATANAECRLLIRQPGEIWQVESTGAVKSAGTSILQKEYMYFKDEPLRAGCDLRIDADTDTNNTIFTCGMCIVLVDD